MVAYIKPLHRTPRSIVYVQHPTGTIFNLFKVSSWE